MVKMTLSYEGDLRCKLVHGPSGAALVTDAPTDNQGKGQSFSPTDLVASALGTCMLTVMGLLARREGIRLEGTEAAIEKEMIADPLRRIARIGVKFRMAPGIAADKRPALEKAALTCPVYLSLAANVEKAAEFSYPD